MKKVKSILLALSIVITACFGSVGGLMLKSKALEPESFTVNDIVVYEGIDSEKAIGKDSIEYEKYSLNLNGFGAINLSLSNGNTVSSIYEIQFMGDYMMNESYEFRTNADALQEAEHWQTGNTYEVTAEIIRSCNNEESVFISTTFYVTVNESPVESLVISDLTLYEEIDKEIYEDGNFWELGNRIYNMPEDKNYIKLKDSSYCYLNHGLFSIPGMEGKDFNIKFTPEIDPTEEPWQIGNTYKINAKLVEESIGYEYSKESSIETTFNVTIEPNPIESIEMLDITLHEDLAGSEETDWETGETYRRYYGFPEVKVTFKDGSQGEFIDYLHYGYSRCEIYSNRDEMQSKEHWTAGNTYIVTGSVAGFEDTFKVTIAENPVASIDVSDITLYEGLDSNINTDWMTGEEYNYYDSWRLTSNADFTVNFKDGTKKKSTDFEDRHVEIIPGRYWGLGTDSYEMQQEEHWTVGNTYEVTGNCAGVQTKFNVTIAPNPVESIEISDMTLIDKLDGYTYGGWDDEEEFFYFTVNPTDFTVTLKNGTKLKSDNYGEISFDGRSYWLSVDGNDQYENHWEVGKTYELTGEFAGVTDKFNVTIEESYTDFTISGKNQLILTFTKKNGQKDVYRALDFEEMQAGGNEEEAFHSASGYLYTDRKIFNADFDFYRNSQGLKMRIGYMESNILPKYPFLNIDYDAYNITLTTTVDTDGDSAVTCDDAIYLIYHIFKPDEYPVSSEQDCDFNGDGKFDTDDAIYLLYHIFLPEKYPI